MSITVTIKGTNETVELSIIDPESKNDWIKDFMSMNFPEEFAFDFDASDFLYTANQCVVNWWVKVIDDHQAVYDRMYELKELGEDYLVDKVCWEVDHDLEDWPAVINQKLTDALAELSR